MNRDFYREHAPFFDSCGYTNQLAEIIAITRSQGFLAGCKSGLKGNVALPWLEAAALARIVDPSRELAVWLQWVWLAALALSLYWYFVRYRGADPLLAICLTLPFVSFESVYHWAGGLPDFRMDLSLYVFLSLFAVWYLATYETDSSVPWLLCGVAGMLACLGRATSPVYLAVMFGPLLVIRFWFTPRDRRKALLWNVAWMGLPIAVAVVAFLVQNFAYLHYYYVVWSPDANRNLPWRQSIYHLAYGLAHLGLAMALCSSAVFAFNCRVLRKYTRSVDWKVLYLAIAPGLFLVVRGAGLNPYVSIPAVFGCLLFAFFPFRGVLAIPTHGPARAAVCALLAGVSLFVPATAKQAHRFRGQSITRMQGVKALIDRMEQDALRRGLRQVNYIIPAMGDFHSCMFENVLIYEYGGTSGGGPIQTRSGLAYSFPQGAAFTASDQVLWERYVPGRTDEEKLAALISMVLQLPDYLLLPTDQTLDFLERNPVFKNYYINWRTRELKRRVLETNHWIRLGSPAEISPNEHIEIYTRDDRLGTHPS